ncbi:MAG TPA: hypothetical protein VF108_12155 [Actinomycetota bacterium]
MEGSGSSGFDMSKMSTAEKLLAGGSILLLIDSFLPWQRFCVDLGGLEDLVGGSNCASFTMWGGSGGWAGVIAGLLTIALIVVGVLSMSGAMSNMNMGGMSADKVTGFLGLGVVLFGLLKFLLVLTNEVGWAAFVGLVLLAAIGWGAWERLQASGGFSMGGGTAGGGTMDGGMGGGMPPSAPPPSSTPPPSAPPPSAPPSAPPPSDMSGG